MADLSSVFVYKVLHDVVTLFLFHSITQSCCFFNLQYIVDVYLKPLNHFVVNINSESRGLGVE